MDKNQNTELPRKVTFFQDILKSIILHIYMSIQLHILCNYSITRHNLVTCNTQPQHRGLLAVGAWELSTSLQCCVRKGSLTKQSWDGKGTSKHGTVCTWMEGHLSKTQTFICKPTTNIFVWSCNCNQGLPECMRETEKVLLMSYKKLFHNQIHGGLGAW